jgi:hypothetical protein
MEPQSRKRKRKETTENIIEYIKHAIIASDIIECVIENEIIHTKARKHAIFNKAQILKLTTYDHDIHVTAHAGTLIFEIGCSYPVQDIARRNSNEKAKDEWVRYCDVVERTPDKIVLHQLWGTEVTSLNSLFKQDFKITAEDDYVVIITQ